MESNIQNTELAEIKESKKSRIGIAGGLSIVIGNIIGSGIFVTVSGTMEAAPKSLGLTLVIWVFGGLVSLIGAICYVELFMYVKKSGGEKAFLSDAFGKPFGIVFLYTFTILDTPMNLAYGALTIGSYITDYVQMGCDNETSRKLIAVAILVLGFLVNATSLVVPIRIQIVFSVAKVVALIIIIITGFVYLAKGTHKSDFTNAFNMEGFDPFKLTFAITSSFWTYGGWNTLGHIAGEMKRPKRDLLISFILGLVTIILLYILTVISYVAVVGMEVASETTAIASALGRVAFGNFGWVSPLFICISTTGYVNGIMMTTSRIGMVAAHDKEVPYMVGLVHRIQRTPVFCLFFITLLACIFTQVNFDELLSYSSFLAWAFYFLSMVALFYFRYHRKIPNEFKVPVVLPLIVMASSVYIVVMSFYDSPLGCSLMLIAVLVLFALHYIPRRVLKQTIFIKTFGYFSYGLKVLLDLEPAGLKDIS